MAGGGEGNLLLSLNLRKNMLHVALTYTHFTLKRIFTFIMSPKRLHSVQFRKSPEFLQGVKLPSSQTNCWVVSNLHYLHLCKMCIYSYPITLKESLYLIHSQTHHINSLFYLKKNKKEFYLVLFSRGQWNLKIQTKVSILPWSHPFTFKLF